MVATYAKIRYVEGNLCYVIWRASHRSSTHYWSVEEICSNGKWGAVAWDWRGASMRQCKKQAKAAFREIKAERAAARADDADAGQGEGE